MDEMMNLINSFDLSAAELTQRLSDIGNGSMLDGIRNIYYEGFNVGHTSGYQSRRLDEAMEASKNITRQKATVGGICLLTGAAIAAISIWLFQKHHKKRCKKHPEIPISNDNIPVLSQDDQMT